MKPPRRQFLHLAAAAAAFPAVSRLARAQSYPTRPVYLIEGFGAGSSPDIVARLIGQALSERLGQAFIVENRAGATGIIATDAVVRAPPDGYTLLLITAASTINTTMLKHNFDFIRDITPVASIARVHSLWRSTRRFRPTPLRSSSPMPRAIPARSIWHQQGPDLCPTSLAKCSARWQASTCFTCLIAAHKCFPLCSPEKFRYISVPFFHRLSMSGPAHYGALAVTTTTRSEVLPDVPALAETLPGYEASAWYGIGAPKGTPPEVIERLNKEVNFCIADPRFKARLANLAGTVVAGSPTDLGKLILDETKKWDKVILAANIK